MPGYEILTGADDLDRLLGFGPSTGADLVGAWDDPDAQGLSAISGLDFDPFNLGTSGSMELFTGADLVGLDSVVGAGLSPAQQMELLKRQNAALRQVARNAMGRAGAAQAQARNAIRPPVGERGRLQEREPKRLRKYPFALLARTATLPNATDSVIGRPQVPMKIKTVKLRNAGFWNILDLKVGKDSQNAGGDPIPGEIFDSTATDIDFLTDTASNGQDIIISFQNMTAAPRVFHAVVIGYAVE